MLTVNFTFCPIRCALSIALKIKIKNESFRKSQKTDFFLKKQLKISPNAQCHVVTNLKIFLQLMFLHPNSTY